MNTTYEETYKKLRNAYLERLKKSAAFFDGCLKEDKFTKTELLAIQKEAHGLAGSGAIFGFPDVTASGRKLDSLLDSPQSFTDKKKADEIKKLVTEIRAQCLQAATSPDKENSPRLPAASASKKRTKMFQVMLIDDDEELSAFLSMSLLQRGIRMIAVHEGSMIMQSVQKHAPDFIILDISLPSISGHEILQSLRKDPRTGAIPILMLTGKAKEEDVIGALNAGAIGYVVKPFDPEKLITQVEGHINALRPVVLITDNDPLILQLLEREYVEAGFRVILAENGEEALQSILKDRPDLVVLDHMMPLMSGAEVFKKMQEEKTTKDIPVIILSARNQKSDIDEAFKMGVSDYVTKPFEPENLIKHSLKLLKLAPAPE